MKRKTSIKAKYETIEDAFDTLPFLFQRWYGFDVDGTIADNSKHSWLIDTPIKPMVNLMKRLHREGKEVRILSGRLGDFPSDEAIPQSVKDNIWEWCDKNLGFRPALTGRKDSMMEVLYDDRARQVICNKGVDIGELARQLAAAMGELLAHPKKGRKRAETLVKKCRRLGLA